MVKSEYAALSIHSAAFGSLEAYQTSRKHVMTRSFNSGPEGCRDAEGRLSKSEQNRIETKWGLEKGALFAEGCHPMVPILDLLKRHHQPNVVYQFDSAKQAFVISAKSNIPIKC